LQQEFPHYKQQLSSFFVFIGLSAVVEAERLEDTRVKRIVMGLFLLGVMGSATMFAQNGYWAQQYNDGRWRDYRHDKRDLRRDYIDRRNDWRDIRDDKREIARNRWELPRDLRNE